MIQQRSQRVRLSNSRSNLLPVVTWAAFVPVTHEHSLAQVHINMQALTGRVSLGGYLEALGCPHDPQVPRRQTLQQFPDSLLIVLLQCYKQDQNSSCHQEIISWCRQSYCRQDSGHMSITR